MAAFPRLTHIALHVSDLQASIAFYQDYCGMIICRERLVHPDTEQQRRIVWMAEPGREQDFIFVIFGGGQDLQLAGNDYRHFGFALDSRAAVDAIAERARQADCLLWQPREEAYPVGYYCGLRDPNGNYVGFSYGQPLGPGALSTESL